MKAGDLVCIVEDASSDIIVSIFDEWTNHLMGQANFIGYFSKKDLGIVLKIHGKIKSRYSGLQILTSDGLIGWVNSAYFQIV